MLLENQERERILSGKVWLDETYYSVITSDKKLTLEGKKLRGLSENQICIGVACTNDTILCILEGKGQPSKRKTYNAFKDHILPGSTLIHDKASAHNLLIEKLNLVNECYNSKDIIKLPSDKNPLNRVNNIHSLLKKFLYAHSSFNRDSFQGYLDLFSFALNPPNDKLEKVEILMKYAFNTRKRLRYRDFYR